MRSSIRSCGDPWSSGRKPRPLAWGLFLALVLLSVAIPAAAQSVPDAPTLSTTDRLDDRRYVTTGDRAYVVGTEAGRFPAMGFHTRGEMGGLWSPPIKLLDGLWFGIDDEWIGPATRFTSGYGHVKMDLPGREGLTVERTDFVPDGRRAVLVGLKFTAGGADQSFALEMDAHSELMGAYPWGETNPSQTAYNLEDSVAVEGDNLVFREQGTPPTANALPHDWAAVVGSDLTPVGSETGEDFRGPQEPVGPEEHLPGLRTQRATGSAALRRHRVRQGQGRPAPLRRERTREHHEDRVVRGGRRGLRRGKPGRCEGSGPRGARGRA